MATPPQDEIDKIVRYDRPSLAPHRELLAICQGCKELTERVERLERLLGDRGRETELPGVSTLVSYWTSVGIHALCAFILYSNQTLLQFGMMMTIGAIATLVVTQVLSTRPMHERIARTLLSTTLVSAAAMAGLWLGDVAEPADMIPWVLMLFPPVFASGWIVAKSFVWIRGWRIVPPGYATKYPKLQIQHLMLFTLLFALYLAATQMMVDDLESWFGEGLVVTIFYLCIPTSACTLISCLVARIFLGPSKKSIFSRCAPLAFAAMAGMAIPIFALIAAAYEWTFSGEVVLALLTYVIPLCVGVFASSGSTFAMMRIANYRFARTSEMDESEK